MTCAVIVFLKKRTLAFAVLRSEHDDIYAELFGLFNNHPIYWDSSHLNFFDWD
jgi:hypothetical protein